MSLLKKAGLAAAALSAAGIAANMNRHLTTSSYTLKLKDLPPAFEGLRILHISDLHAASFGKDQKDLLAVIDALDVDMTLITGDLIDRRRTLTQAGMRPALVLLSELARRMPTVRVDGNHETMSAVGNRFRMLADSTGVQNVTGRGLTVRKGDDHLVIVGIPDIALVKYDEDEWQRLMRTVCAPYASSFRVALAHRPQFLEEYAAQRLPLVLSGHAHGGQVRLPKIGGLFAPEQGIFPKLTSGVHEFFGTTMVISRGLGNSGFPLRFNNRPELVVITLKKG